MSNSKINGQINLPDIYLNHVRKGHGPVTVFLTNGVKLSGILTWFDEESLTLTRDGITQLVFRHAISTIMPDSAFQIFDLIGVENEGNLDNI